MDEFDFVVVGGGIAGAGAAWALAAPHGEARPSVVVLERESQPGYHSTGRSAAVFSANYGNDTIRALTRASRAFFEHPPAGFSEHPLWSRRAWLYVARAEQLERLDAWYEHARSLAPGIERLDAAQTLRFAPMLRDGYAAGSVREPDGADLDVDALHRGFLRGAQHRGARLVYDAEVETIERSDGAWRLRTRRGARFAARVLVNAAGAWGDEIAARAGAKPIGLQPKRRTAILFPAPPDFDLRGAPVVVDIDESFYFKPDAGKLLGSPADETDCAPCDAQPEELDVAIAAARIEEAVRFPIARIENRWAGLRTFAPDRSPVVGYDDAVDGFFWLVGQGGYGIQTAPALSLVAAALARRQPMPADVVAEGIAEAALSPRRLRTRTDPDCRPSSIARNTS
ncbi:MAG: FAD-binding oxidoreductase [Burkholderiaceae bacterium]|nr:FAD-binding oxidoreductase [Burkholderiaceae bacterium]